MNINNLFSTGGGNSYAPATVLQPQKKPWRPGWSRKLRLPFIGIYFYVSNVRLKKRPKRDLCNQGLHKDILIRNKEKLYERQQHRCPHCGKEMDFCQMELHHILPVGRFPEFELSIRNGILLCHGCHKEVHMNPWKEIAMMKTKAAELGVDLKERYDYGQED